MVPSAFSFSLFRNAIVDRLADDSEAQNSKIPRSNAANKNAAGFIGNDSSWLCGVVNTKPTAHSKPHFCDVINSQYSR